MIEQARGEGLRCEGVISVAFGCPTRRRPARARAGHRRAAGRGGGARRSPSATRTGMANPAQVGEFFEQSSTLAGVELTAHFHNTRGQGLAQRAWPRWTPACAPPESSFGELGGCPVPPGATGNIAAEDLVSMLHEMGERDRHRPRAPARSAPGRPARAGAAFERHLLSAGPDHRARRRAGRSNS